MRAMMANEMPHPIRAPEVGDPATPEGPGLCSATGLPPTGDPTGAVTSTPIFTDLLHRVSRIRVATRAIARIRNIARKKSFLGLKERLTEEEESLE